MSPRISIRRLSLHFIIILYTITTPPCLYTLYKTIFIPYFVHFNENHSDSRHGNRKTGWPNRISSPVTVKVWHGKGFFFSKLTKSLIFLSFFWPSIWDSQEIITTPYLFPPTLCFLIPPVQLSSENIFQACEAHFMPTKDSKTSHWFWIFFSYLHLKLIKWPL